MNEENHVSRLYGRISDMHSIDKYYTFRCDHEAVSYSNGHGRCWEPAKCVMTHPLKSKGIPVEGPTIRFFCEKHVPTQRIGTEVFLIEEFFAWLLLKL